MRKFRAFRSRGQTMILIAVAAIALIAFVGLAVDGGMAYSLRRQAQNAADGSAIAGTWVMAEYAGDSPKADILRKVNEYAQAQGVRDTNGDPTDIYNDNVEAYYVDYDGNRLEWEGADWEIHAGPDIIPGGARGVEAVTVMTQTTFFLRAVGVNSLGGRATATARYQPDGGILPIAVNEYWLGSQGHCPYANCGEPYSFVRDPGELPPFSSTDGGATWERNFCADPYNDNTCQGAYDGYSENYGKAFAILGGDAKPNYGSQDPRSLVHLDYRYSGLADGDGDWYYLVESDTWMGPVKPLGKKGDMGDVIRAGGYSKVPIPAAVHEPPPAYIGEWGYCWGTPPDDCFNHPQANRSQPYEVVEFLSGADASDEAKAMYDGGNYVEGRFAPGQRLVIMVYNSLAGEQWDGSKGKDDVAVIVGYFGCVIVAYGTDLDPCACDNFDVDCFQGCIKSKGQPNTVYGMVGDMGDLTIDPSKLLEEFLPKKITLIR
ncbi:MAG: Tad domain-containing protein [Chloroflexia bacterium]|nr:Tad domain-containing protein [Chloroflexia bacterium]